MIVASYFDHNATTPVAAGVLTAFLAATGEVYGNPSSIHTPGQIARQRLESARREVALLLGADPKEIVFTSGGTESDNLALFGVLRLGGAAGKHVITTVVEHPAVLGACAQLAREGAEITYLPCDGNGLIDPGEVRRALTPQTALVSIMHANNETGVLQPLAEIAAIAREAGVPFHSDGVQVPGRLPVNVRELAVDLYSLSGHKLNAPKGIGALYVRNGIKLQAMQYGGRHERERRAGTENVPGAVALGAACRQLGISVTAESAKLASLRDRLERGILSEVADARVNGGGAPRIPNTTNLCFDGIEGESLVIALDLAGFAVSTGAACSSGAVEPSHVLRAMGLPVAAAKSSLRFSLGFTNTEEEVDALVGAVAVAVARLRKLSPSYTHAG